MPVQTIAATRIWAISLEQIEATVADYLGPGRVKSKSPAVVFSRHVSMYLAQHVGGWCYPKISRFYACKHYATVSCAVRKIGRLSVSDESVDDLIEMLTAALSPDSRSGQAHVAKSKEHRLIVDAVGQRLVVAAGQAVWEPVPSTGECCRREA